MVSTKLKKQYIQTDADLNAAFKDNMYFGLNRTEGKRASNQNMMNMLGITGYRHTDISEAKNAAYIANMHRQNTMLNQAWSTSALNSVSPTIDNLVSKAANWIADTTDHVKTYIHDSFNSIEDSFKSGYSKLSNAFQNAAETTSDAIENSYAYVAGKVNNGIEATSEAFSNGYAYAANGLKSGWASAGNYFNELTEDSMNMLRGTGIAGNLMGAPRPAMAYAAPAPRL
tara:strand:- start:290251 stop:290934 length:684 start_codon:yes stop_codon:yes gene_type:complete